MVKDNVGQWKRVDWSPPDHRRSSLEHHVFAHESLPVRVMVYEETNGSWYVKGDIRGTHERTIADNPYGSKSAAFRAAYEWMRQHPHPARMVTEDRNMRERESRRAHEEGLMGEFGGAFEDRF